MWPLVRMLVYLTIPQEFGSFQKLKEPHIKQNFFFFFFFQIEFVSEADTSCDKHVEIVWNIYLRDLPLPLPFLPFEDIGCFNRLDKFWCAELKECF